jgi:hypothetical protein
VATLQVNLQGARPGRENIAISLTETGSSLNKTIRLNPSTPFRAAATIDGKTVEGKILRGGSRRHEQGFTPQEDQSLSHVMVRKPHCQ